MKIQDAKNLAFYKQTVHEWFKYKLYSDIVKLIIACVLSLPTLIYLALSASPVRPLLMFSVAFGLLSIGTALAAFQINCKALYKLNKLGELAEEDDETLHIIDFISNVLFVFMLAFYLTAVIYK